MRGPHGYAGREQGSTCPGSRRAVAEMYILVTAALGAQYAEHSGTVVRTQNPVSRNRFGGGGRVRRWWSFGVKRRVVRSLGVGREYTPSRDTRPIGVFLRLIGLQAFFHSTVNASPIRLSFEKKKRPGVPVAYGSTNWRHPNTLPGSPASSPMSTTNCSAVSTWCRPSSSFWTSTIPAGTSTAVACSQSANVNPRHQAGAHSRVYIHDEDVSRLVRPIRAIRTKESSYNRRTTRRAATRSPWDNRGKRTTGRTLVPLRPTSDPRAELYDLVEDPTDSHKPFFWGPYAPNKGRSDPPTTSRCSSTTTGVRRPRLITVRVRRRPKSQSATNTTET